MCGFAGAIQFGCDAEGWRRQLDAMGATLIHRGPDDDGQWFDAEAGIGLAHRRLAILDVSPAGHQPMVSPAGRYVIAYNGEIYNFQELRRELPGVAWRGHSDTEVLLAALDAWGVRGTVTRLRGMFAFALWDRTRRKLFLVRDRLGIKPLYYGNAGGAFVFGSELKALRAHPASRQELDRDSVAQLLRFSYVPAPWSIYEDIKKLEPGTMLRVPADRVATAVNLEPEAYWSLRQVAQAGQGQVFEAGDDEAVDDLDRLLREAVRMRMIADVPLGAFLSGGMDSSTVVALMQAQSDRPVKTFTIGFGEAGYNEAHHARAIADHLGTEHTELVVRPQDALDVIPKLPAMYDEPFADSSQIPTFLVSQLARRHVTVSLSGDGGDELFGGYPRYALARDLWGKIGAVPPVVRRAAAAFLETAPGPLLDLTFFWAGRLFRRYGRPGAPGDKAKKLGEVLAHRTPEALYQGLVSHWKQPERVVLGSRPRPNKLTRPEAWAKLPDLTHRMMYLDGVSYLPDDILVKVDRASMAVGLEARVPIIDHKVVEFAWRLPLSMKLRDGGDKWALRQVLYRYVPRALVDRPKMGFGVPIDSWLRGPLREWGESLLAPERLRREGILDPAPIRAKWQEHQAGARNQHYYLWDVLMFQAWLEQQR